MLDRRQGSGNYVRAANLAREVYGFFRLERPGGGVPSAAILSLSLAATPSVLGAPWGEAPAWRIRRLRLIGGEPVAVEEIRLDRAAAEALDAGAIGDSLYLHYGAALGLFIAAVTDRLGAAPMPGWAPSPLVPGAAAGHVLRHSCDGAGRVREVSRTWFDPARAAYVSRQGRAPAAPSSKEHP